MHAHTHTQAHAHTVLHSSKKTGLTIDLYLDCIVQRRSQNSLRIDGYWAGGRARNWLCMCVCVCVCMYTLRIAMATVGNTATGHFHFPYT
jgi:hypothetical protein